MQTRSTKVSTPKESKKRNRTMGTESGDCVNQSNFGEGIVQFYTGAAKDVGDNIGFQDGNTPKSKQTTLLSHWLFSDEASAPKQQKMVKRGINRPDADVEKSAREFNQTTKHSIESAHASTVDTLHDVPVIAAPSGMPVMTTGFTTASGKPCPVMNPEEKKKMRKLLGLDSIGESDLDLNLPTVGNIDLSMPVGIGDINNEANELSVHSIDTATESPRGPDSLDSITAIAEAIDMADFDGLTTTKDVTIVVDQDLEDRMLEKVECVANTERKYVYANSTKAVTLLELWCRNCIVTNHDGSSLSPAMLARLWNVYGNPLIVDYETIENFTFINYSPCDGIITVGGLKEMQQCFRQLLEECVEKSVERHRFDEQWLRKKYCIFALSVCRKFQKALFKAMHNGGTLKEALLRVRLPNPLSVIRQIIKAFHDEYGGKESILTCILQGDAPANSPVVVMVEHIDGNYLNISDGMSTFTAFAADCYVRQLLKSQRIVPGSKILLNGILIGSDKKGDGDAIIQINYNMVSPAPRRRIGLQNKHGNMHIRELKGGAGYAMKLDVTVLGVMPPVYKVLYKQNAGKLTKWITLSDWDFNALFEDPEYKPPVDIESVYVYHTLHVIDTIMLLRIKDYVCDPQKFEKALVKSCAILTLRNMDETSISMIQPTIRLTLTDLRVKNSSVMNRGNRMTKQGALIGNSLCFDTTSQTSIDFKEHDTPLQKIRKTVEDYRQGVQSEDDLIVGNKSIFHTLILGEPVLSIGEHEEKVFYDLLRQGTGVITDEQNDVFLDQICSVTGVVIEAGEITNLGQNTRMFRLFLLTTRLQIAVVKVMERVVMFPGQNGKQKNVAGKLERIRQRLLAQRLTVARDPQTVVDKKDTVFIKCLHLQYDGFDELNKVHNFNTSSSRVVIRDCNMLQSLHKCLLNGILFAEGTGCALSYKALMSTGETDTDQICRAYAKALVQSKIKIYHLLNRYDDERALCEEMISNCR